METKDRRFEFVCTEAELALLGRWAREQGVSKGAVVRLKVFGDRAGAGLSGGEGHVLAVEERVPQDTVHVLPAEVQREAEGKPPKRDEEELNRQTKIVMKNTGYEWNAARTVAERNLGYV